MRTALVALLVSSVPALGASVSGRITSAGVGLAGMEVRLWARTAKGFSFGPPDGRVVTTTSTGDYVISGVPAGTYKLDTRMGPTLAANYGDRWYDVAPPASGGYLAQDADELVLSSADARTGVDIAVEVLAGADGRTMGGVTPLGGLFVRLESAPDFRVHHNDTSKTTPAARLGEHSFRGMPAGSVRLVVHDPNYTRADVIGPTFAITSGVNAAVGDLAVVLAPADPNEPNDGFDAGTAVDVSALRLVPPQPIVGAAAIGPRSSGDVDFYCWDALEGDRYFLSAIGTLGALPDGGVRESPWVDPVVSFWRDGALVAEDDDSGPGTFDARLDTGPVQAGRVCAAVTTFGDTLWRGLTQGSAGPYQVRLELGNRAPRLTVTVGGTPAPTPPATVAVNEGTTVTADVGFSDPDGDALTASWELRDSQGQLLGGASFNTAAGTGQVPFALSQTAARRSPYTLTLRAADAEFTTTRTVVFAIAAVNVPPAVPLQLSPDAGARVTTSRPSLVCREASDDDADPLRYEFQLAWLDGGALLETGQAQGDDAGIDPDGGVYGPIAYVTSSLPENARLVWRVRAFDGNLVNGYSPWSPDWRLTVDVTNEPPAPPRLVKPADGETVMLRRPTLEVLPSLDPEDDAVSYIFELSRDVGFTQVVVLSPAVPDATQGAATMWTVTQDLDWGGQYFARAVAVDARGARSAPGNTAAFRVRTNQAPMAPIPGMPFSPGLCADQVFTTAPTSLVLPPLLDVEQDAVVAEVQVAKGDDAAFAAPLLRVEVPTSPTAQTSVSLQAVTFENGQRYRVRARAKDGQNVTEWVECSFTLDTGPANTGGGPAAIVTKPGCGCASVDPLLATALAALLLFRRRTR